LLPFPTPNACPGFKEVCKEVELTYKVKCEDIMGMPSVFMFCFNRLNQEIEASAESIMEVKETGKTKKLCGVQNFIDGKPANLDWSLTQNKK
jgi:hypothetical protein